MARNCKYIVLGLILLLSAGLMDTGQVSAAGADETEDWFARGTIYIRQRQWDEAIAAYAKAIELLPHDFEAHNNRAVAHFYKQDYDLAISNFTAALKINPNFPEALSNRGITWFHKQTYAAAVVDTTAALKLNPYLYEAYWGRAAARTKRREYEIAVADYQKLIEAGQEGSGALKVNPAIDEIIDRHTDALVLKIVNKEVRQKGLAAHISHLKQLAQKQALASVEKPEDRPKQPVDGAQVIAKRENAMPAPAAAGKAPATKVNAFAKPAIVPKPAVVPPTGNVASGVPALPTTEEPAQKVIPVHETEPGLIHPYTVHLYSFQDVGKTRRVAAELGRKIDHVLISPVMIPGKGWWYRVLVGFYAGRSQAKAVAAGLKSGRITYTKVLKRPYAVSIQVEGTNDMTQKVAEALEILGYTPYHIPLKPLQPDSRWLAGAFKTREEARIHAQRLREAGYQAAVVVR